MSRLSSFKKVPGILIRLDHTVLKQTNVSEARFVRRYDEETKEVVQMHWRRDERERERENGVCIVNTENGLLENVQSVCVWCGVNMCV